MMCGSFVPAHVRFCPACGKEATHTSEQAPEARATIQNEMLPQSTPAKAVISAQISKPQFHYGHSYLRWLMWILALGVSFGLGQAAYLFMHGDFGGAAAIVIYNTAAYFVVAPLVALVLAFLGLFRMRLNLWGVVAAWYVAGGLLGFNFEAHLRHEFVGKIMGMPNTEMIAETRAGAYATTAPGAQGFLGDLQS